MTYEPIPEDRLYDEKRDAALLAEAHGASVGPDSQAAGLEDREPLLDPDPSANVPEEPDAVGNDHDVVGGDREAWVRPELAMDLRTRWDVIQRSFVDDPRNAVSDADSLVDEVMRRLSDSFTEQLRKLESEWHEGEPSTEDLRTALKRYRTFFNRLLEV